VPGHRREPLRHINVTARSVASLEGSERLLGARKALRHSFGRPEP